MLVRAPSVAAPSLPRRACASVGSAFYPPLWNPPRRRGPSNVRVGEFDKKPERSADRLVVSVPSAECHHQKHKNKPQYIKTLFREFPRQFDPAWLPCSLFPPPWVQPISQPVLCLFFFFGGGSHVNCLCATQGEPDRGHDGCEHVLVLAALLLPSCALPPSRRLTLAQYHPRFGSDWIEDCRTAVHLSRLGLNCLLSSVPISCRTRCPSLAVRSRCARLGCAFVFFCFHT